MNKVTKKETKNQRARKLAPQVPQWEALKPESPAGQNAWERAFGSRISPMTSDGSARFDTRNANYIVAPPPAPGGGAASLRARWHEATREAPKDVRCTCAAMSFGSFFWS